MNKFGWIVLLALMACGGSLSDEQRKRMKNNMELNKVRKVSEAQIVDEAYREGKVMAAIMEQRDPAMMNTALIDSLEQVFQVEIVNLQPNDSLLRTVEQKIIEAYTSGGEVSSLSDNVQRMGLDSLLYTKPIMRVQKDGSVALSNVLGIRLLKKNVILSIKD
jgi:urease gamma subunit